jgi:hypothetical protein
LIVGNSGDVSVKVFYAQIPEIPGDVNCDGRVDGFDIDPFVLVLSTAEPYEQYYEQYPYCDHLRADVNTDGAVNGFDIDPFVDLISGG